MSDTPASSDEKRRVILLSGMSGAGLLTALKMFEDLGYEAVDNLRLGLVPAMIEDVSTSTRHLAAAIDTRNASFNVEDLLRVEKQLAARSDLQVTLVFLDCSDETLQRRFTETRRRHPLAFDRPAMDGIRAERVMLWKLKNEADFVFDTSETSIHDLRRLIAGHFSFEKAPKLTLYVTSFSYRHGIPREADIVFDARFLKNPHWDPALRPQNGKDNAVAAYIREDPDYETFMNRMLDLLLPLLPRYQLEGKSYLTIGVGCSGGRHRSVTVAQDLANRLTEHGYSVAIGHRDLDRNTNKG